MTTPVEWTWLAHIRRYQGRKGEVFADILTDFPEKFSERHQLWLLAEDSGSTIAPRSVELVNHWPHKGGIVLHFAGIDSISSAETLAGLIVAIPREQRAALNEDEIYISDLVGCTLYDVTSGHPVPVGTIDDVDRSAGPVSLLVIKDASGEILIPFAKSYLRTINLAARRVEMALPEGLVDVNR